MREGRPDPREMEAEVTAVRRRVRELEKENEYVGKASAFEVWGSTYGAARIQCALTRGGVDVGVRAVVQSMRRLGLTGLHARPHHSKRGGPVAHEDHCARQWDQDATDRVRITDFTYLRCAQG